MKKATRFSYPTILKTLRKLEKEQLVKCIREEASAKGGKEKKIYALTSEGLFFALLQKRPQQDDKVFKKIMNAHLDKLLIFRKWSLFEQAGLGKFLTLQFTQALLDMKIVLFVTWDKKPDTSTALEKIEKAAFFSAILLPSPCQSAFIKTCKQDVDLRKTIEAFIKEEEKTLQGKRDALEKFKTAWRS